jgi:hypothetical protein
MTGSFELWLDDYASLVVGGYVPKPETRLQAKGAGMIPAKILVEMAPGGVFRIAILLMSESLVPIPWEDLTLPDGYCGVWRLKS